MATAMNFVLGILILGLFSPELDATRFGSKAKTIHLRSAKGRDDLGEGYRRFRRSNDDQKSASHLRETRSADDRLDGRQKRDEHDKAKVTAYDLNDSNPELIVHWAGAKSDMIVCLTRDIDQTSESQTRVYFSYDYGTTFDKKEGLNLNDGSPAVFDRFYHIPSDINRYLFVDTVNKVVFRTIDGGSSWTHFTTPVSMTTISMHQTDPDIVLGMEDNDIDKRLYKSENFGATWTQIQSDVKSFWWGVPGIDRPDTVYIERLEPIGVSTIVMSEHYFDFDWETRVIISNVLDFEVQDEYLFATQSGPMPIDRRQADDRPNIDLLVSHQRGPLEYATFPSDQDRKDYYIADANEDQVFVCVNHNLNQTNLYISEVQGTSYSLSLENIVYYSPEGPGKDSWLSQFADEEFVELHWVEGLRGIYIASKFMEVSSDFKVENMVSVITYDKGGEWNLLEPLESEMTCQPPNCSLHLSQKFSQLYPGTRNNPILSKVSAPGMIMAMGKTGESLGADQGFDVYRSPSAGATWYKVLDGPHFYAFGDHGGIVMAVDQFGSTEEVKYSVTEGETWITEVFTRNFSKVYVYGMMTEPGEQTTIFTLFGSLTRQHSWMIVQVDLKDALGPDCGQDDYKQWSPSDEFPDDPCLLGRKMIYERRIAHAVCFNGRNYDRPVSVQNCTCTREDFECDVGFFEVSDWWFETQCIRDLSVPIDPDQIPSPCPPGTFYRHSKGYRKVAGDTCSGGEEYIYEADMLSCPIREMPEFMLYTRRTEIHRYLFNSDQDERLALDVPLEAAIAVDFDWHSNVLYWADMTLDAIYKYSLDTGNYTLIADEGLQTVEGLAFDWIARNLYWVDSGTKSIEVARHDGRFRRTLANETQNLDMPRAIALDPKKGNMYWTDWGSNANIMRAEMDGANPVVVANTSVHWPNGITIDDERQQIYWTDAYLDRIEMANMDGSNRRVLISEGVPHPYAIAVYKDEVYWDDWQLQAIMKVNKYSGGSLTTLMGNLTGLMDLKIFQNSSQQGVNPCRINNGNCSQLCIAVPGKQDGEISRRCRCADGFRSTPSPDGGEECHCEDGETMQPNGECKRLSGQTCHPDQFACGNGNCVPLVWRCDHDNDCGDMTDEFDCPYQGCQTSEFECHNNNCIPLWWLCDFDDDCGDMSDENNCTYPSCSSDEFTCDNDRCIPTRWICDGDNDCRDSSDERDCTTPTPPTTPYTGTCSHYEFHCDNGKCIPFMWQCDGDNDCGDMSDEHCTTHPPCSSSSEFQCGDGLCIQLSWRCDGNWDCVDGSDEVDCSMTTPETTTWIFPEHSCHPFDFHCLNGECIFSSWKCDGVGDCSDGSDEFDCATMLPQTCNPYQFQCYTGFCIPEYWQCDFEDDCGDGSDERNCETTMAPTRQFTCNPWQAPCDPGASVPCVPEYYLCDGFDDCGDNSDERNCPTGPSSTWQPPIWTTPLFCRYGYFKCSDGLRCVNNMYLCNGIPDCEDESDEDNCPTRVVPTTTTSDLCPSGQFQCEDLRCLPSFERCDGDADCLDGTDESGCHGKYIVTSLDAIATSPTTVHIIFTEPMPKPQSYNYYIYYRLSPYSGFLGPEKNISNVPSAGYRTTYDIQDLTPGARYQFSVAVHVINGDILYDRSSRLFVVLPYATSPPGPPTNVQVKLLSMTSVNVTWDAPRDQPITDYKVMYRPQLGGRFSTVDHVRARWTEIPSLEPNRAYVFKVAAHNNFGVGNDSNQVVKYMSQNPDEITVSPRNVSFVAAGPNSVTLSWKRPDTSKKVNYYVINCGSPDVICKNTTKTTATVGKLCQGTTYVFQVAAGNSGGIGLWSDVVSGKTEGDALTAPINLATVTRSMTKIDLTWGAPVSHGAISTYDIYYDRSSALLPHQLRKDVSASTAYTAKNLISGVQYAFQVSLSTNDCLNPPRSPIVFGSTAYDEQAPVRDVSVITTSTTSITVGWKAPRDAPHMLTYKVVYNETASKLSTTLNVGPITLTDVNATIPNLVPGLAYTIVVSTGVNNARLSPPMNRSTDRVPAPREFHAVTEKGGEYALSWLDSPKPYNVSLGYTVFRMALPQIETLADGDALHVPQLQCKDIIHDIDFFIFRETDYVPIANTTDHFMQLKSLPPNKSYILSVSTGAFRGIFGKMSNGQCVDGPTGAVKPTPAPRGGSQSTWIGAVAAAAALIVLLVVALTYFVVRHRRLQRSFMSFANSHYDPRSGTATFTSGDDDDLGDEEDQPMIRGFSDDEPLVVA